jgi:hypothetical protein
MTESSSVLASSLDIRVMRGDTFTRDFAINDSEDEPYDFDGFAAYIQVKKKATDSSSILSLSSESGEITLTTGHLGILVPAADMNLTPGTYVWDLQMEFPGGETQTWIQGKFIVVGDVTRVEA